MRLPVEQLIETYKDNVYRAAFSLCKNGADADDIVQDTFLKYYRSKREFASEAHIRAWLLRVAINQAKDLTMSFWQRNRVGLEEYMLQLPFAEAEDSRVFGAVMELPARYRIVLHLYYYEGYCVREIAEILRRRENTIKSRLARGRALLKDALKEAWNEDD